MKTINGGAINIQAIFDGLSAQWQKERAETQMTLGKLIATLEEVPADVKIWLTYPHSYRGYYEDLALSPTAEDKPENAAALLAKCKDAMGRVFEGYKGGDFVMGELTPVWVSNYGESGKKLMAIREDGTLELEDDN